MNFTDMKLYTINSVALAISFTDLEMWLKIILLLCTIIYTLLKIKKLNKQK
tara:strand:+ start:293 stop:445 length:153 start_codon:yes stop_codon:yes gene_type:complete